MPSRNVKGRLLRWQISYDKRVVALKTWQAKLLYTWIIPSLDNLGRMEGEPRIIRSMIFPLENLKDKQVEIWLQDIHNKGLLFWYGVNGEKYLQCPTVEKNVFFREGEGRKRESDYPSPPEKEYKEWIVQTRLDTAGHVGVDLDLDLDKDLDKDKDRQFFPFEEIYLKYPKKVGKKAAEKHFKASINTERDWQNIQIALKNYLASERVAKGFIQNASTWFYNWPDWVNFKEDLCPKCKGKGKFISSTGYEIICDCPKGIRGG
jgi:hypothetical protein